MLFLGLILAHLRYMTREHYGIPLSQGGGCQSTPSDGCLNGVPCCWSALHDLVRRGEGPILCVNDLTHFDATLSFGGGMEGQMPAESMGWRPDIPVYSLDLVEDFARCPLWQAWLTRGPNGVVVSLFSMP